MQNRLNLIISFCRISQMLVLQEEEDIYTTIEEDVNTTDKSIQSNIEPKNFRLENNLSSDSEYQLRLIFYIFVIAKPAILAITPFF